MGWCSKCGEVNPDRARLCMMCGNLLNEESPPAAEERKIVSILFVDLVDFTERFHEADPEDVGAILTPYHARLKQVVERFSGAVEKFIGDAVMAVFGAPVGHEDDAERAVRAALAAIEAIDRLNEDRPDLDLHVRAAVNTGEGLVSLAARPEAGESWVTGDVVNTASRMQQLAPVDCVVVGEATYRATTRSMDYRELTPQIVKGKPEPLALWVAIAPKSRFGVDVGAAPRTPLVGRSLELDVLKKRYLRALETRSLIGVVITGEPGVGKSRLISEFFDYTDGLAELISWRQGRSIPYGEGITFWALGEIVKAETGILESDDPETAAAKLRGSVDTLMADEDEREWLVHRLAPLVGAHLTTAGTGFDKADSFAGWRRYLEALTTRGPLVLVFEDLHWADPSMLEFLEGLATEWNGGAAMVLCTARPELRERYPSWGTEPGSWNDLVLLPLSDQETEQLVTGLLSDPIPSQVITTVLLERVSGNPLFAEEFVRMLADKRHLERSAEQSASAFDAAGLIPDTLAGLIGARLDMLPSKHKQVLQSASVAGKVFWSGAVAALEEIEEGAADAVLREIAERDLVIPTKTSSIEGQREYMFRHSVIRDVAYGQMPRSKRGRGHVAMASWLEIVTGDRLQDRSEVLAHHYLEAMALASATGASDEAERLRRPARRFLTEAGDRAMQLDVAIALRHYRRALDLMAEDDSDRADALEKCAGAAADIGSLDDSEAYYREAFSLVTDRASRGRILTKIATDIEGWNENKQISLETTRRAVELLDPEGPSVSLARAYVQLTRDCMLRLSAGDEAVGWAERAVSLADVLGDPELSIEAYQWRGVALVNFGDPKGIHDMRRALDQALALGSNRVSSIYGTLAMVSLLTDGTEAALNTARTATELALRRGLALRAYVLKDIAAIVMWERGDWNEALSLAQEVVDYVHRHGPRQLGWDASCTKARILLRLGRVDEAAAASDEILQEVRSVTTENQILAPSLVLGAEIALARGDVMGACSLIEQFDAATAGDVMQRTYELVRAVRVSVNGDVDMARRLTVGVGEGLPLSVHATVHSRGMIAEATNELDDAVDLYRDAAIRWEGHGFAPERGMALLGMARCLIALGRREEADQPLKQARRIFLSLGASPYLELTEDHFSG